MSFLRWNVTDGVTIAIHPTFRSVHEVPFNVPSFVNNDEKAMALTLPSSTLVGVSPGRAIGNADTADRAAG